MYECINDIKVGVMDDIVVLVKSINTQQMQNGTPYQKVSVRDRCGTEETFLQFDCILDIPTPIVMKMTIECVEYGSSIAFKIKECIESTDYTIKDFLPKPRIDYKKEWAKIVKITKKIRPGLSRILCSVIAEDKNKLLAYPLNPYGAFARQSGNIEATTKLAELAELTAIQNGLDVDLMLTAAVLYYNGNLETVSEGYSSTTSDVLFGSAIAAVTKVQAKVAKLMEDEAAREVIMPEDVNLLCHILASKDNVKPAIPEASALSRLDRMIQEIDIMNESIKSSPNSSIIKPSVGNYRIYNRTAGSNS